MVGDTLLSLANKHVHMADSLFIMYETSNEPRILLRVLEHCVGAIEEASQVLSGRDSSTPVENIFEKLANGEQNIKSAKEAVRLYVDLKYMLEMYRTSPQVFAHKGSFIIANKEFSSLEKIDSETVSNAIDLVKRFVYEAGRVTVMNEVSTW